MPGKTLYLIDGHAQIYRAYYAPFGMLTSPAGEPTRATHVFTQMLLGLLRDRTPDYLAMVMDVSDKTVFRVQIDPGRVSIEGYVNIPDSIAKPREPVCPGMQKGQACLL